MALAVRVEALEQERQQLASVLRAAEVDVDLNALRPMLERRLGDLRAVLDDRHPERARRALREPFRRERIRVGPDPERGFRVEGTAWLSVAPESRTARDPQDPGRFSLKGDDARVWVEIHNMPWASADRGLVRCSRERKVSFHRLRSMIENRYKPDSIKARDRHVADRSRKLPKFSQSKENTVLAGVGTNVLFEDEKIKV